MPFIDALSLHSGGARTHLRELLREWSGIRMLVLAAPSLWHELNVRDASKVHVEAPERTRNAAYRVLWRLAKLPAVVRASGASVYIDPAGGTPALSVPRVTMVRNMLPFDSRVTEWYGRWTYQGLRLRLLRKLVLASVARSDGTIYISRWSRDVIEACLTDGKGKSTLISHGVKTSAPVASAWPQSPRWLYVSDVSPYKHQVEAVLAYDAARAQGCQMSGLILAGGFPNPDYEKKIRATIARARFGSEVDLTSFLGREALSQAMARADALLIVSSVECCPNVLLEALALGKPIVCSNEPPMPEFAKESVVYVDPSDPMAIADGMRRVARMNDAQRRALGEKARAEASRYTWKNTADRTWAFINEIAVERGLVRGLP